MNMKSLRDEYIEIIEKDIKTETETAAKSEEYLKSSTAKYHGITVKTCHIPKVFTQSDFDFLKSEINVLYGIFGKVMRKYFEDPEYRKLFGFDKLTERLILSSYTNDFVIPIARIDIFYNEETREYGFCEFNTDGTSAMNEDRELNIAVGYTNAFNEFKRNHSLYSCELFDSWVKEFGTIYEGYRHEYNKGELKNIAIVDFPECATSNEFKIFKDSFIKAGYNAEICDITALVYDGESLCTKDGFKIDAIYRRAVTCDIIRRIDEVKPFMEAVRDKNVCIIGDFFTQIVHNKILYKVIHMSETMNILDEAEQEYVKKHIPYTAQLTDGLKERIISEKDEWILKPEDSYGSKGVYAGVEYNQAEWREVVRNLNTDHYIAQSFLTPYKSDNYIYDGKSLKKQAVYNLTGLFVYNGKLNGIYSRVSKSPIISTQYSEMALATLYAKK